MMLWRVGGAVFFFFQYPFGEYYIAVLAHKLLMMESPSREIGHLSQLIPASDALMLV